MMLADSRRAGALVAGAMVFTASFLAGAIYGVAVKRQDALICEILSGPIAPEQSNVPVNAGLVGYGAGGGPNGEAGAAEIVSHDFGQYIIANRRYDQGVGRVTYAATWAFRAHVPEAHRLTVSQDVGITANSRVASLGPLLGVHAHNGIGLVVASLFVDFLELGVDLDVTAYVEIVERGETVVLTTRTLECESPGFPVVFGISIFPGLATPRCLNLVGNSQGAFTPMINEFHTDDIKCPSP